MTAESNSLEPNSKRDIGIPLLGALEWGTSICLFYETLDDLFTPTVSFLKAGLENHECCIWSVSAPVTVEAALMSLRAHIPPIDSFLQSGAISVTDKEQWDVRPDEFNLQRITSKWTDELAKAQSLGFDGLRISGNASWLEAGHWSRFCQYDEEFDRTVEGKKIILLCTHSISAKRAVEFAEILRGHHFTLYCRNGAYEFPDTPGVAKIEAEFKSFMDHVVKGDGPIIALSALTRREKVILAQIVRGASSKAMAIQLGVSPIHPAAVCAVPLHIFDRANAPESSGGSLRAWRAPP